MDASRLNPTRATAVAVFLLAIVTALPTAAATPTACFTITTTPDNPDPPSYRPGTTLAFDALCSSDPDDPLKLTMEYQWDWDTRWQAPGWDTALTNDNTETHVYSHVGVYKPCLLVQTYDGLFTDTVCMDVRIDDGRLRSAAAIITIEVRPLQNLGSPTVDHRGYSDPPPTGFGWDCDTDVDSDTKAVEVLCTATNPPPLPHLGWKCGFMILEVHGLDLSTKLQGEAQCIRNDNNVRGLSATVTGFPNSDANPGLDLLHGPLGAIRCSARPAPGEPAINGPYRVQCNEP